MSIKLLYDRSVIDINLPSDHISVVKHPELTPLKDEEAAFFLALNQPISSKPLDQIVLDGQKVALVIPDGTRPLPSKKLLTWLFEALSHKKNVDYSIILGTGSHRANTREELIELLGNEIVNNYRIINHDSFDKSTMKKVGDRDRGEVWMNKYAVEADVRIALGFIEPHLWAGFSGGYKAIMPGITDIETISHYHRGEIITHPGSTWGQLEGNPTQELIRRYGQNLPIDFLINMSMTPARETVAFYCGDPILAHEAGCEEVKKTTMVGFPRRFPIVITTNNGFPLDQNLYQCGKGLSAAAQIVEEGGLIILACACSDGFPHGSNFHKILTSFDSPQAILDHFHSTQKVEHDQWSVHMLVEILSKNRIMLYSQLPDDEVQEAHLIPIHNIEKAVKEELDRIGHKKSIAVLPEGFLTIPYIEEGGERSA